MRIAILGWGSLIKEPRELAIDKSIGDSGWLNDGPLLPIEFSRISKDKRLTLVIDERGKQVQTLWAISTSNDLITAIENLAARENTPSTRNIGFANLKDGSSSDFSNRWEIDQITSWATQKGINGVIWTGLKPNFEEKIAELFNESKVFNLENIKWFVEKLQYDEYLKMRSYIENAPPATNTSLRKEIEKLFEIIVTDQVLIHEAGHISLARAFGWDVDDIKDPKGSTLSISFTKVTDGKINKGVITSNTHDPLVIRDNWERTIISQGGLAAEKLYSYRVGEQFDQDLRNSKLLLSLLPTKSCSLEGARAVAAEIIEQNRDILQEIKGELKRRCNGDKTINFKRKYPFKNIPKLIL